MDRRVRSAALLAILGVLLGGVVVVLWRGDPLPTELLAPLGVITAALVWAERNDKEGGPKRPPGEGTPPRVQGGDGESS